MEDDASVKKERKELQEKERILRETRERMGSYFNKIWKNFGYTYADYQVSAFTVNIKAKYAFVAGREDNKSV